MRGQFANKTGKTFWRVKNWRRDVFPTLRFSQSDGRGVRAPPLIGWQGRRSGELVRPKASSPKGY